MIAREENSRIHLYLDNREGTNLQSSELEAPLTKEENGREIGKARLTLDYNARQSRASFTESGENEQYDVRIDLSPTNFYELSVNRKTSFTSEDRAFQIEEITNLAEFC